MSGFKSLQWAWSILLLSILFTASLQPVSAVSEKQFKFDLQDNYDANAYSLNLFLQADFEHNDDLRLPERDYGKKLNKLNFFLFQHAEYGGEPMFAAPSLKRYALLIPAMNSRTLIYPFHSFL